MDIKQTIKNIEIDSNGHIKSIVGVCKAKDFNKREYSYLNIEIKQTNDIMEVLGIRRMC